MGNVSVNLGITAANGKKTTKAITDIKPTANNADINQFIEKAMDLTTNTLTAVTKITKEDIDKTYTTLTFAIDTNTANSSVIPTKIDDTHYTIAHADLWDTSKGVWKLTNDEAELYWGIIRINITPKVPFSSYVVMEPKDSKYIWAATNDSISVTPANTELSIFTDTTGQSSQFVGVEFNLIIQGGSSGSTNWDTHSINFKIV